MEREIDLHENHTKAYMGYFNSRDVISTSCNISIPSERFGLRTTSVYVDASCYLFVNRGVLLIRKAVHNYSGK